MKGTLVTGLLAPIGVARRTLMASERTLPLLLAPGLEGARWRIGRWRAWRAFEIARREVPAYRDFLGDRSDLVVPFRGLDPDLSVIPVTDKASYVRRYPVEARCRGGEIPAAGVMIDESSGTSGLPSNWVRGREERADVTRTLQAAARRAFGREPLFVVNAFALGPWATGMNVSMSLLDIAVLKSTGPDIAKIEATLRLFGSRYRYLILGYPPFLKSLVDRADVDWERLRCMAVFGGEGMSEGMRDYLGRAFDRVYGSYGASDLEINMAAENDGTIALRRLLAGNPRVAERLLRHEGAPPMIFQYDPTEHAVETTAAGDLVVTSCRPHNVSPRVRYNIGDLGHAVRFPELRAALAEVGMAPEELGATTGRLGGLVPDLPLLFLYGRSDLAIPFYGCKVTPADIEAVLFSLPDVAPVVSAFQLVASEDARADKRLTIALELTKGVAPADLDREGLRTRVMERLAAVNQDFREAARMIPRGLEPDLELHPLGTGPFAGADIRLKRQYIRVA